MEVHFSPETEIKLTQAAAQSGRAAEEYVRDLVERFLNDDIEFREAVRKGFTSLDRGDFIDEEEMNRRVGRLLRS